MANWTEAELREYYERRVLELHATLSDLAQVPKSESKSESLIQAECVKLMEEDGWRPLRTDPVSDKGRGKGFGEVGMADYLFVRYGSCTRLIWVEFKARKGKVSAAQTIWHRNERARGATTWIAGVDFPASVEGFREHYAASGLRRR